MKRLFICLALVASLSACAQRNVLESLALTNDTIATTASAAETALRQGFIDIKEACTVEQYSRLAGRLVDEAHVKYSLEGEKSAKDALDAARAALRGGSEEAIKLVNDHCSE